MPSATLLGSNNTNKLSPQEHITGKVLQRLGSNNTNKLSPQELLKTGSDKILVQIIQINLVLKNSQDQSQIPPQVQIIQINLVLKNS